MPIMRVTCYNDDDDDDNDQLQLRKLDRPAAATSKQDIRAEEQRDEVKERHTKE